MLHIQKGNKAEIRVFCYLHVRVMELKDIIARLKRLITAIFVAAIAAIVLVDVEFIPLSVLEGSIASIVYLTLQLLFSAGSSSRMTGRLSNV